MGERVSEIQDHVSEHIAGLRESISETRGVRAELSAIKELAAERPQLLLPHVREIAGLLDNASGVVQKGSLEILAILSEASPEAMAFVLPRLHDLLASDPHNTVASRAIDILTNYARTGKQQALAVMQIFGGTIDRVGVRPATKMLTGLGRVVAEVPGISKAASVIAERFESSLAASTRSAARALAFFASRGR